MKLLFCSLAILIASSSFCVEASAQFVPFQVPTIGAKPTPPKIPAVQEGKKEEAKVCTPAEQLLMICKPEKVTPVQQPLVDDKKLPAQQPVVAEFVPCEGVVPIVVTARTSVNVVLDAIRNYRNYLHNEKYQICFQMDAEKSINSPISFQGSDREVIIKGLHLAKSANFQGQYLLDITSAEKVSLINATLRGSLHLSGADHSVEGSFITGDGSADCLVVDAEGAEVKATEISQCLAGIKIRANNFTLSNNSKVYSNRNGMYVVDGIFGTKIENSFSYANDDRSDDTGFGEDAIYFENQQRKYPFRYFKLSNQTITELSQKEEIILEDGSKLFLIANFPVQEQHTLKARALVSDLIDCNLPENVRLRGQGCLYIGNEEITYQVDENSAERELSIPDEYTGKQVVFNVADEFGTYSPTVPIVKRGRVIVSLGGVQPIIIPTTVAENEQGGGQQQEVVAVVGGDRGAIDQNNDGVADGFAGGDNSGPMGGPTGGSNEESFSADQYADAGDIGAGVGSTNAEEILGTGDDEDSEAGSDSKGSGPSITTVAVGGDGGARLASGVVSASDVAGATGGCSLNISHQTSFMNYLLLVTGLIPLARTRRKI